MPIDDHPFDALAKQFEAEKISISPVSTMVCKVASSLPLLWPFDKAIKLLREHASSDSLEKVHLMLKTCMDQVRRLEGEVNSLRSNPPRESEERERLAVDLVLDASRKASVTRAKDRVKRIGLILGSSISQQPVLDADEVEEMMRVAMELGDRDMELLRELVRVEGSLLGSRSYIPRYDAHALWEQTKWGTSIDPEIDSVFCKLESYGLVARIAPPNNLTILADYQNRYVLLNKGVRFAALAREAASS